MDIGQLLASVDHLLETIDSESLQAAFSQTGSGVQDSRFDLDREFGAMEEIAQPPRDGFAEIHVSADRMEATADFFPPVAGGRPLSTDEFWLLLQNQGVINGLFYDVVTTALEETAFDLRHREGVVVARGAAPIPYLPARTEILFDLTDQRDDNPGDFALKDFKLESPFIVVKKGDFLALTTPEQPGVPGKDVLGNTIPFPRPLTHSPVPGRNVVTVDGGMVAGCNGSFRFDRTRLWVDPILVLDSGVDYSTGHIDFVGDIHIRGEIAAGFRIQAQGSVFSNRVIDATEIISGGDVVTPLGIIGRGGAVVKTDGGVRAKFLENVCIVSRGSLEIRSSVLNCLVQTLDRLVMGTKGLLLGGKVQALNGIDVFQVGSDRGAKAEIVCGMDFSILNKVIWARDQSLSLVKQMKVLEAYQRSHPSQRESLEKAMLRTRNQVRKLSELARELVGQIDRNEEAEVTVRGQVYPGTYIEICHVTHVVVKPLSRVKFLLDKKKGRIEVVPL